MNVWMDKWMDVRIDRLIGVRMDKWKYTWMDVRRNGCLDAWMDG